MKMYVVPKVLAESKTRQEFYELIKSEPRPDSDMTEKEVQDWLAQPGYVVYYGEDYYGKELRWFSESTFWASYALAEKIH